MYVRRFLHACNVTRVVGEAKPNLLGPKEIYKAEEKRRAPWQRVAGPSWLKTRPPARGES